MPLRSGWNQCPPRAAISIKHHALGAEADSCSCLRMRTFESERSDCQSKILRLTQRLAIEDRAVSTMPHSLHARVRTLAAWKSCEPVPLIKPPVASLVPVWALGHRHRFPVDINRADKDR